MVGYDSIVASAVWFYMRFRKTFVLVRTGKTYSLEKTVILLLIQIFYEFTLCICRAWCVVGGIFN